jgi:integrase
MEVHSMASIYKRRGSDIWTMNFSYRGVRINRSTGQRGEEAALKIVRLTKKRIDEELGGEQIKVPTANHRVELDPLEALLEASSDEDQQKNRVETFEQAIKVAYLERFESNVEGDITYRRLATVSKMLHGDKLKLKDISRRHIQAIREKLLSLGKSKATVNRYMAHIRTVLYMAKDEWEVISRLPKFNMYKEKEGRLFFYSKQQERDLLAWYIKQGLKKEADLIAVLFDTGMRMGEALKMEYDRHIDLEGSKIILTADICKSGKPRTIPLTQRASYILKKRRLLEGQIHSGPFSSVGYSYLQKRQKLARKELGLPDEACFHACRHTCATRLLGNGVDIRTVQEWLGHSSITTTERYLKTTGKRMEKAAQSLNYVANEG